MFNPLTRQLKIVLYFLLLIQKVSFKAYGEITKSGRIRSEVKPL